MKLHLGCGDVYLDGWINIDIKHKGTYLAEEDIEKRDYNKTTIDKYYKYDHNKSENWSLNSTNPRKEQFIVADKYMDLLEIPYPYKDESISEILIVGTFEHFNREETENLIKEWYRILKKDGTLYIDVPDLLGTFEMLKNAKTVEDMNWAIRLIYGSQKNEFSYHKWGFMAKTLIDLCKSNGFKKAKEITLIEHSYPTLTIEAIK